MTKYVIDTVAGTCTPLDVPMPRDAGNQDPAPYGYDQFGTAYVSGADRARGEALRNWPAEEAAKYNAFGIDPDSLKVMDWAYYVQSGLWRTGSKDYLLFTKKPIPKRDDGSTFFNPEAELAAVDLSAYNGPLPGGEAVSARDLMSGGRPAPLTPAEQAKKEAWDELAIRRGQIASMQAMGNNPYQYMQTMKGHVTGGQVGMGYADFAVEELRALCDQELEFQRSSVSMGDEKGAAEASACIAACLDVLHSRQQTWNPSDPPVKDSAIEPPHPPHDPSRGRTPA